MKKYFSLFILAIFVPVSHAGEYRVLEGVNVFPPVAFAVDGCSQQDIERDSLDLVSAIYAGDLVEMKRLLNKCANPNFVEGNKQKVYFAHPYLKIEKYTPPICLAVNYSPKEVRNSVVGLLLEYGANPNIVVDSEGNSKQGYARDHLLFSVLDIPGILEQFLDERYRYPQEVIDLALLKATETYLFAYPNYNAGPEKKETLLNAIRLLLKRRNANPEATFLIYNPLDEFDERAFSACMHAFVMFSSDRENERKFKEPARELLDLFADRCRHDPGYYEIPPPPHYVFNWSDAVRIATFGPESF
jgi:hypothetical protein